jgi:hypothetical protein
LAAEPPATRDAKPKKRTGRVAVFAVRVRNTFKGDILALQSEFQLARWSLDETARKASEGEVMEFLLDSGKAALCNGAATPSQVPLANAVCLGLQEIARHLDCSPADAGERLVAEKIGELGLLPKT